jgi:hypothetical protein
MPYAVFVGVEANVKVWVGRRCSRRTVDSRRANWRPRQARGPTPKG